MPAWLINILISMVVKFGLPMVLAWLKKKFPNLPIPDQIMAALQDLADELKSHNANKKESQERAKRKLRKCSGVGCPATLKDLREEEQ